MTFPYTLASFTNGPDTSGFAESQAAFDTIMGGSPSVVNAYMDFSQSPSNWPGSAGYVSSTFKVAAIPMIGLPISSTALSTEQNVELLQAVAAGSTDYVDPVSGKTINWPEQIQGYVATFKAAGFDTQYWRPCVEMNQTSTPGFASWQSDPAIWIAAWKEYYTQLHQAAEAAGVEIKVIWNPGLQGPSPAGLATETLWPGAQFVDVIGADTYDNNNPETESEAGALTFDVIATFALEQKLPLMICEIGCGQPGGTTADNPAFIEWIRGKIDSYVVKGLDFAGISIWDNGNWAFSAGSQRAAAWAANFGINAPAAPAASPTTSVTPPTASFTVSKPGTLVVGTEGTITDTAGTQWGINSGKQITFTKLGGSLEVEGTSADVDQLYWDGADLDQLNGSGDWWTQPLAGGAGTKLTAPPKGYTAPTTPPTVISTTALPQSSFEIYLSGDQYQGAPEAEITVDGHVVATNLPVPAVHGSGQWMGFTWEGNYGAGQHTVAVTFLNDLYNGTPQTDRNLWFGVLVVDGQTYGEATEIPSTGNNVSLTVTTLH